MDNTLHKIKSVPDFDNNIYYLYDENDHKLTIPRSVAIILDGNGRYAKKHNIERAKGHEAGCKNLEVILEEAVKIDVKFLTVYAFSTENWKRSTFEINSLFDLFFMYLNKIRDKAMKNNVKVQFIGDIKKFPPNITNECNLLSDLTKDNSGLIFSIAFNYGSRDEILRAVKRIYSKNYNIDKLTIEDIADNLDTYNIEDPDLLIRTSGEYRLSNFLLWQLAYTELYFTDTLWPEFDVNEFYNAIYSYNLRERRFGGRSNS